LQSKVSGYLGPKVDVDLYNNLMTISNEDSPMLQHK